MFQLHASYNLQLAKRIVRGCEEAGVDDFEIVLLPHYSPVTRRISPKEQARFACSLIESRDQDFHNLCFMETLGELKFLLKMWAGMSCVEEIMGRENKFVSIQSY
jgi:hypothetical protein